MEGISKFNELSLIVIGDVMLDSYWYGDTKRISPEAPVPVVKVSSLEKCPGGAANVALNIKSIGANVKLIGICGDDDEGKSLTQCLTDSGIESSLIKNATLPTINKLRVLSQSQQLMRLDFEKSYESIDKSALNAAFVESLSHACMVIISDYAKGTLTNIPFLIEQCKKHHIPVIIDPKGSDYSKYKGASMLTPNRKEFELIMGECNSEAEFLSKGQQMLQSYQLENLLVTRGSEGMTLFRYSKEPYHLPAKAKSVYDVTGAGDTVIGVLSTCLGAGMSFEQSLKLANYAAGLVVGKVGAATVSASDLQQMEKVQIELSIDELNQIVSQHKESGRPIFMISFDKLSSDFNTLNQLMKLKEEGMSIYVLLKTSMALDEQRQASQLLSNMSFIDGLACIPQDEIEHMCLN